MSWTAIIPIKEPELRKTRLAQSLSPLERTRTSHHMMLHVARTVSRHRAIDEVVLVSQSVPTDWSWSWRKDEGRGLNAELDAARSATHMPGALIILPDLPLMSVDDIDALIAGASKHGVAIAPDRHGSGTNAIAIKRENDLRFQFGADSYNLHLQQLGSCATVVREGLGFDLDTPEDLELIMAHGPQPLRDLLSSAA